MKKWYNFVKKSCGHGGVRTRDSGRRFVYKLKFNASCITLPALNHRAAAYYQLFSGNRIVISGETWSKCQFFSKKVKNYSVNWQKTVKLITFLLLKTSPKSIVLLTFGLHSFSVLFIWWLWFYLLMYAEIECLTLIKSLRLRETSDRVKSIAPYLRRDALCKQCILSLTFFSLL